MRRAALTLILTLAAGVVPAQSAVALGPADGDGAYDALTTPGALSEPTVVFDAAQSIVSLPATVTGTVSNYREGETLTFHLDKPIGPVLESTVGPHPVGVDGSARFAVTLPAGVPNGPHDIYVIGQSG